MQLLNDKVSQKSSCKSQKVLLLDNFLAILDFQLYIALPDKAQNIPNSSKF